MRFIFLLSVILVFTSNLSAQDGKAYQIYGSNGKKMTYKKMIKQLKSADCILFGEYHDNSMIHWLQQEVTKEMIAEHGQKLILGFEMFERHQQDLLDSLLTLKQPIRKHSASTSEQLWPNYKTDYEPLIDLARTHNLKCIATNVPRKYASMIYKIGRSVLDTLSSEEKTLIGPLDFIVDTSLSQYAALSRMNMHGTKGSFVDAQALKDVTMAESIAKAIEGDNKFIHFNGAYHSDFQQSIIWYLKSFKPKLKILSITTVTPDNISKFNKEDKDRANFIIYVPENMTRTH